MLSVFPPFMFLLRFNRHDGEGSHHPSRQKSRGPGCADLWESEKQAQWPRRRLFQVHQHSRRATVERLLFPAAVTWGQHFTKMPPHDYRLHSQLRLWVFIPVACLATWLPACPAARLVDRWSSLPFLSLSLSLCAHHIATRCQPIDHPHDRPPCVSVTTHRQDHKWAKS